MEPTNTKKVLGGEAPATLRGGGGDEAPAGRCGGGAPAGGRFPCGATLRGGAPATLSGSASGQVTNW